MVKTKVDRTQKKRIAKTKRVLYPFDQLTAVNQTFHVGRSANYASLRAQASKQRLKGRVFQVIRDRNGYTVQLIELTGASNG